jgi:hypothetical protein
MKLKTLVNDGFSQHLPRRLARVCVAAHVAGLLALSAAAGSAGELNPAPVMKAQGGAWVVQAQHMQRGQLAQELARLSGTALLASPALMDRAAPATVQLRTRSLADAWRAVLGNEFSHALMCDAVNCKVWVTGLLPRQQRAAHTPGAAAGGMPPPPAAATHQVFTSDPPGLFSNDPAGDDKAAASATASGS